MNMRHFSLQPIVVIAVLLLCSCTADKPSVSPDQRPSAGGSTSMKAPTEPSASGPFSLEIFPREPNRRTILSIKAAGFEISSANVQWLVNGSPVTTEAPDRFNCSAAAKGSTVEARATVQGQEVRSNSVEIRNTLPELTKIKLMPEIFKPGDVLMVEVETIDIDGDPVSLLYSWTKNDAPAGSAARIAAQVRRGDRVRVSVTPSDGVGYGTPVVLEQEILNYPPHIVEHGNFSFSNGRYSYQVQANDPDGDPLAYSLVAPPEGMTIDRSTGELVWNVPPDFKGKRPVTIAADDGHGGIAQYTIIISIGE